MIVAKPIFSERTLLFVVEIIKDALSDLSDLFSPLVDDCAAPGTAHLYLFRRKSISFIGRRHP